MKTCLADEERDKCSSKMQELVNILKQHLSLCLCGDIMIKLKATNYYCAHCFQTFKGKERVITFCRRRDKCKFYQNGYRLCEHCSNDLMKEGIQSNNNNNNIYEDYIIASNNNNSNSVSNDNTTQPPQQQQQQQQISNTNNNTNIIANHNINNNGIEQKTNEQKGNENDKKNIDWTVCCRIEQRLQQSIQILEQSATDDINNESNDENKSNENDKTQWNEHWNDWISRCNQFSSCLNKSYVFCIL